MAMRLKLSSTRNAEWTCCFCLHVRTASILIGIWTLVLHIVALTVLAFLMRNHSANEHRFGKDYQQNDFLPTPLSKIEGKIKDDASPYYLPTTQDGRTIYSSDMDMGALMTVCTLSITLLMVYGAIKGKAAHLLPYFCLQLFDFAITTLTATGYFCYLRSVHRLVDEHWHNLPFRKELLELSPQYLSLIVLMAFLIAMSWKAYCIGIVWRCYKYLTIRQQSVRNTIHYILPGGADGSDRDSDYSSILRHQEAAFYGPMKQTPPPSYQDIIMNDQPPPYPSVAAAAGAATTATPPTESVQQASEQTPMTSLAVAIENERNVPKENDTESPKQEVAAVQEPNLQATGAIRKVIIKDN